MLERTLDFFIGEEHKSNKYSLRKARLLIGFCWAVILFCVFYIPFYFFLKSYISIIILSYGLLSAIFLIFWFRKTNNFTFSGHFFTFTSFVFFIGFSFITEGVFSVTAAWFIMVPVSGSLLVNKKAGLFWSLLTVFFIIFLYVLYNLGYKFEIDFDRKWLAFINTVNLAAVVLFMLVITLVYERGHEIIEGDLLNANNDIWDKNQLLQSQNHEIQQQSEQLQLALTQITESVDYAQNIQQAILGNPNDIQNLFEDVFLFFKPRNVVSGDFYWFADIPEEKYKIVVIADCTGHGVPGAFMTIVGYTLLNQIIVEQKITNPSEILQTLDMKIIESLRTTIESGQVQDGMDISILKVKDNSREIIFAGAKHHLYIVNNKELTQVKGSPFPIGGNYYKEEKTFEEKRINLKERNILYLFTDGFPDQFGYDKITRKSRKYLRGNFKEFLYKKRHLTMQKQKNEVAREFEDWKKNELQTDDVLVFGLRF